MDAFLIAVAIGIVILIGTVWVVRMIASGPPPDPDPDTVKEVAVDYRCSLCGMRLTVTHAQDAAPVPPKHCREEMDLVDG